MRKLSSGRIALLGLFFALTIVLSVIENLLLPDFAFLPPGAKPGLSNIVVMLTATISGVFPTFLLITVKSLFVLFTRGGSAFFMSLAGGLLSGFVMTVMLKANLKNVSFAGIGMLSAVSHNFGQLLISMLYTKTSKMIYYLPVLILFGIVSGFLTGLVLNIVFPGIINSLHAYRKGGKYE